MKNLFTYFLIFITYTLNAQPPQGFSGPPPAIGRITGKILDAAKNTPLEYSSVTIQNLRDSTKIFFNTSRNSLSSCLCRKTKERRKRQFGFLSRR